MISLRRGGKHLKEEAFFRNFEKILPLLSINAILYFYLISPHSNCRAILKYIRSMRVYSPVSHASPAKRKGQTYRHQSPAKRMRDWDDAVDDVLVEARIAELEASKILEAARSIPRSPRRKKGSKGKSTLLEAFAASRSAQLGVKIDRDAIDGVNIDALMEKRYGVRDADGGIYSPKGKLLVPSARVMELREWGDARVAQENELVDAAYDVLPNAVAPPSPECAAGPRSGL